MQHLAVATRSLALPIARRGVLLAPRATVGHAAHFATANKERPVSPHVLIYDWPLAAISSITTRITGGLLSVGIYGIAFGSLAGADMAGVMSVLGSSAVGPLVKLGVAFPLAYHFMGATR